MCTLVMLRRPEARWPLMVAANRDELSTRPWQGPARHWPDRPEVVAGKDMTAGGSWLGVNDDGLFAAILNRPGTLGPADGKRSRGELVLEALDHAEAKVAAEALADLNPEQLPPVQPDRRRSLRRLLAAPCRSPGRICASARPSGVGARSIPLYMHATTSRFAKAPSAETWPKTMPAAPSAEDRLPADPIRPLDDHRPRSERPGTSPLISHLLPRFRDSRRPRSKAKGDWTAWIELLGDRVAPDGNPKTRHERHRSRRLHHRLQPPPRPCRRSASR